MSCSPSSPLGTYHPSIASSLERCLLEACLCSTPAFCMNPFMTLSASFCPSSRSRCDLLSAWRWSTSARACTSSMPAVIFFQICCTSTARFLAAFLMRSASRSALYSSSLSPVALPSALVLSARAAASARMRCDSTFGSVLMRRASSISSSRHASARASASSVTSLAAALPSAMIAATSSEALPISVFASSACFIAQSRLLVSSPSSASSSQLSLMPPRKSSPERSQS
mmetsp:Transcript_33769/g.86529  ORF Transcript_33769/g.86529 Transcript_33769/m.86529 type:complete len:228 (-) Transcript_33769:1243-1926(-)